MLGLTRIWSKVLNWPALLVAALAALVSGLPVNAQVALRPSAGSANMWFGVIEPPGGTGQSASERRAGFTHVVFQLSWDRWSDGGYRAAELARARDLVTAGIHPILGLGLQYPPRSAFESQAGVTDPDAGFVNQFGRSWRGGAGDAVANGPDSPGVRAAMARYIADVATAFNGYPFSAVEIGGGPRGEAHGPGGLDGSFWMSPGAWRGHPWSVASSSSQAAAAFISFYRQRYAGYVQWQIGTVRAAFPAPAISLMLPSWGVRPGEPEAVAAAGLRASRANGPLFTALIHVAEDVFWEDHLAVIAADGNAGLHSTWGDARSNDPALDTVDPEAVPVGRLSDLSPLRYIVRLSRQAARTAGHALPVTAENSHALSAPALFAFFDQALTLRINGAVVLDATALEHTGVDGSGAPLATLADVRAYITRHP